MLAKIFKRINGTASYALLSQLTTAAYGFGLLLFLVRVITQEELGHWVLFVSAISISDMIMQGLLQTIVVKECAESKDDSLKMAKISSNAFIIGIGLIATISILGAAITWLGNQSDSQSSFILEFARWYPLYGLSMLLFNLSMWFGNGRSDFRFIFIQRVLYVGVSAGIILICHSLGLKLTISLLAISQIAAYTINSIFALLTKQFSLSVKLVDSGIIKEYLHYGKYTVGTLLGSSLLRNSDTFMIAAFLGAGYVAIYQLAQKVLEVFEIILRSVSSYLFPILQGLKSNLHMLKQTLIKSLRYLMLIFIPLVLVIASNAEVLIELISGSGDYYDSSIILQIFMIYVVLLPFDRLIGVVLEVLNLPQMNLIKTIVLISINLIGNVLVLKYFGSLQYVALVSSLALIVGIAAGIFMLNRHLGPGQKITSHLLSFLKFNN